MACLIKAPDSAGKGCVSFTTPERDRMINKNAITRASVESLKKRYLIGLHHNWHDYSFRYDPLFDFSMAGEDDLIERDRSTFARVSIDACNFSPPCFAAGDAPFWDVLNVSRAVFFKGLPEFMRAIRAIYDSGRQIRVLQLCPVPSPEADGTTLHDIRRRFEGMFSAAERRLFTLITMEWDYPFPLDLETLAFFYRSSRVFVHAAPEERRVRTAAYAWASKVPVVARSNVASLLPPQYQRPPFWYSYNEPEEMARAILKAVAAATNDAKWHDVMEEFSSAKSAQRLDNFLSELAITRRTKISTQSINPSRMDIRLGRHHSFTNGGPNHLPQSIDAFCKLLCELPDKQIAEYGTRSDPEIALCGEQYISR